MNYKTIMGIILCFVVIYLIYSAGYRNGRIYMLNYSVNAGVEAAERVMAQKVLTALNRYDEMLYVLSQSEDSAVIANVKEAIQYWHDSLEVQAQCINIKIDNYNDSLSINKFKHNAQGENR